MNKYLLRKLKNAEHLLFMQQISALLTEANIEKINALNTELKTYIAKADEGQKQIRKSEHTQTLITLDKKRDNLYIGLITRLKAEEYSPIAERKEAARMLKIVIDTYKNPVRLNLIEETSVLKNLITELKNAKYTETVKKTGLTEWIQWLEEANNEFLNTHENRRDQAAEKIVVDNKAVRKDLDNTYKKIQVRIEALSELEPSDTLETLKKKIEATVEKYKAIA